MGPRGQEWTPRPPGGQSLCWPLSGSTCLSPSLCTLCLSLFLLLASGCPAGDQSPGGVRVAEEAPCKLAAWFLSSAPQRKRLASNFLNTPLFLTARGKRLSRRRAAVGPAHLPPLPAGLAARPPPFVPCSEPVVVFCWASHRGSPGPWPRGRPGPHASWGGWPGSCAPDRRVQKPRLCAGVSHARPRTRLLAAPL